MFDSSRLWGGRFATPPDASLMALSRSEPDYFRILPYTITGSRAHARELERAGVITAAELAEANHALDDVLQDHEAGTVRPELGDEDVYTLLERVLTDRIGDLAGKLRAGRSRNDQAANDLRLFLRDAARDLAQLVLGLQEALVAQARDHVETVVPGFTHLQPAQPVSLAHHLLAHAQAFSRDVERLIDWDRRANRSPLGAAALAGSAIARSPEASADELGYAAPFANSIDAVSARDHVAEFLFTAAMLAIDLSRLSEEICLWCSAQFGWVTLDDAFSTGSSIMPQKKNPDIAELTRGKAGRLIGNHTGFLSTLKSLPMAYNRDLAEDKHAVLDTVDTLKLVLPAFAGMVRTMQFHPEVSRNQASHGFTLATEVADWMVRQGVPFSEAHHVVGRLVQRCESQGVGLEDLAEDDLAGVDPRLTGGVRETLTLEAALRARGGSGGTAPERIQEQILTLRRVLAQQARWASHQERATPPVLDGAR